MEDIICGSMAGALGKIVEYPFDTVKVRLQTSSHEMFPNTMSILKHTMATDGLITGFYKGVGSPVMGAMLENGVLFVGYNQTYQFLEKHYNDSVSELNKIIISGGVAGSLVSFVLTPVELIKCKLQVSSLHKDLNKNSNPSILSTIKDVVKDHGLKGLWKGQSSTFYRESIGGCIWFSTYELLKNHFIKKNSLENKNNADLAHDDDASKGKAKTWQLLFSGAMAGVTFNGSTFPIDTIKSMVQIDHHLSITQAIKKVYFGKLGIQGFYRGLGITLLKAAPANALVFYTYELLSASLFPKSTI